MIPDRRGLLPAALHENALFVDHFLVTNNLPSASPCLKGSVIICGFILPKLFGNFEALIECRNPALSVSIGSQREPLDADRSEHYYMGSWVIHVHVSCGRFLHVSIKHAHRCANTGSP